MLVAEQVDPGLSAAVIEATFHEDTKHSALACIDVSDDRYSRLDHMVNTLWLLSQDHLATVTRVFGIARPDLYIAADVPRHEHLVVCFQLLARSVYPLERKLPRLFREAHGFAIVLNTNIEEHFSMALYESLLDVFDERGDIAVGGVGEERLQANVRLVIVGEAELVQDAQLVVVFEDSGRLAWWAAQCLLLLHVVGELAERLGSTILAVNSLKHRAM